MVDLEFEIEQVEVENFSTCPMLRFILRVRNNNASIRVKNILLSCQIRIDSTRRSYNPSERERLVELFGSPQRWGETLRSLLWTHANVAIPEFDHETRAYLPAPCTRDFNIASTNTLMASTTARFRSCSFLAVQSFTVRMTVLFRWIRFPGRKNRPSNSRRACGNLS